MIWAALVLWLLAGAACAFRIVPWGARTYYLSNLGTGAIPRAIAAGAIIVLMLALWPLYFWLYARDARMRPGGPGTEKRPQRAF